ncbi:dimethylallyltranstransferase [Amycolatopsis thailandensis]|uniref:Dimethylallyltranstransferase n=1 Tax=Amycolatopsis thailandensis TaxID=589330 RepID=A0A229SII9_9PSEU|nr:family 2 encapsulin nanocompartment cargo protein polyprenyl transferase [Amycolatopsis thailandensis]OXM58666.1 dimethylallyltranstransferase [Amycolatopsis thailandensis]
MTTIDTRAGTRPAGEVLTWSRNLLDPALREAVDGLPDSMRIIAGYHFGWWDEQGRPSTSDGGKALRPALALLSAQAVGGDAEVAVPVGVAVEMVHNFSLLHDDVMDRDTTRRHRPTAWTVFGTGAAILAGDALLCRAFEVLAPFGQTALRVLSSAVIDLLEGQSADLKFEERGDVDTAECVRMAEGKTGALLGASCTLGALAGEGRQDQVDRLTEYGRALGLAFQHIDDLLGIWGDPEVTGKPVHSDLSNRKKSLPVVAALHSGTEAGRELDALYRKENLDVAELPHAAELVERAGGRAWSQEQADALLTGALHHLAVSNPVPRPGAELAALAKLVVRRRY